MSNDGGEREQRSRADPPRLLGERYELIEVVGSGASAITWRALDRRLDRPVAVKVLRRDGEQDATFVQRFEREARISASISDANVVQVFDVGQQDGWLYLVMQFIGGEDLKHLITWRGSLDPSQATDILRQMLSGLSAIHRAGILHRDIKSQNVMIDRDGKVRVTDFGIAQVAIDPGLTAAGMAVGTAAYMAPEQAEARPLSEATDIYAAGVVLYEMLAGRLPFERESATATMLAHMQDPPLPPSQLAPQAGISPRLDGIVRQAMAKSPADRFQSAAAMSRALQEVAIDLGATTRIAPPRSSDATRVAPKPPARFQPARSGQPPRPPVAAAPASTSGSGGGRGPLNVVLVLILLAMVVMLAYLASDLLGDRNAPGTSPGTSVTLTQPPPTQRFPPTDAPGIIEPSGPQATETVSPTEEPTPTQEPTTEPTPTEESTVPPTPEPTATPTAVQVIDAPIEPLATDEPPISSEPTAEAPIIEPRDGGG